MRIVLNLLAFVFGFGLVAGTVGLVAALGPNPFPALLVAVGFGIMLGSVPKIASSEFRMYLAFAFGFAFVTLWFASSRLTAVEGGIPDNEYGLSTPLRELARSAVLVVLGLIAGLSFVRSVVTARLEDALRRAATFLIFAAAFGVLVAYFSGPSGGSGWMMRFLMETLGLSQGTAEVIVLIGRKSVHVLFYGVVAQLCYRGARAGGASRSGGLWIGLGFPVVLAGFDEHRQSLAGGRTGSAWDFLLDMGGALLFLWLAGAFRKPNRAAKNAE